MHIFITNILCINMFHFNSIYNAGHIILCIRKRHKFYAVNYATTWEVMQNRTQLLCCILRQIRIEFCSKYTLDRSPNPLFYAQNGCIPEGQLGESINHPLPSSPPPTLYLFQYTNTVSHWTHTHKIKKRCYFYGPYYQDTIRWYFSILF